MLFNVAEAVWTIEQFIIKESFFRYFARRALHQGLLGSEINCHPSFVTKAWLFSLVDRRPRPPSSHG
ncbi:hypothetical protein SLE2022_310560 [Rubroshorea leprosula]